MLDDLTTWRCARCGSGAFAPSVRRPDRCLHCEARIAAVRAERTRRQRFAQAQAARYGLNSYHWRPAPFGRLRTVAPDEARNWGQR